MNMPKKATHTSKSRSKGCVGELCWNPERGKLEFSYDKATCPPEVIKRMEVNTPMVIKEKDTKKVG